MPPSSAIPDIYYFIFAAYEPFLTTLGFIGTCVDPITTHNAQAPWPKGMQWPELLPPATIVTIVQLAHVCALIGFLNCFVLTALRKHLHDQPAIQEKITRALLAPLLIGDVLHLVVTFWGLGDHMFDFVNWTPMLWTTHILGISLLVPRLTWHLGVGRYVDARDGPRTKSASKNSKSRQAIKS
ncbi:hypothetical protein AGABI2DRAFT_192034 [Agaricus bisporus var. bisporus H97]|uniref:hypothetical protein n=1 Tax=Agaricus bisporus var. bisporus (strain H97 / ATCC MYA-4626 / FGSC 10389) TaxID=936046 RepID=UPI00029F79DB|nr:hypothetical protein AGABI2DRAFT_192034 [Agaricus bisporus var. bisporus H97]EKV48424.1 hypothetical protein AGABI2DRAFT_192034 [Agaricus bisporus var. bisporus H97]